MEKKERDEEEVEAEVEAGGVLRSPSAVAAAESAGSSCRIPDCQREDQRRGQVAGSLAKAASN